MRINAGRTVNGVPRIARLLAENPILRIDGLVATPLQLTPDDIRALPHTPYLGNLSASEAGTIPPTDWTGVLLSDLIELAAPTPEGRFVRIASGPYGVPVALEEAAHVLLCDGLAGEPLSANEGGPWRLVIPQRTYFTSVKWVDRIEITAEKPDDSATRIAIARAKARAARAQKEAESNE